MAPVRQVCHRQLEILLEFAEANKNLVKANTGRGPTDQREADKAWTKVALRLNSIGDGVSKTPISWKRYWQLMKCRAKFKAEDVRRSLVGTGGGANKTITLTDIEKRIVAIIGKADMERVSKFTKVNWGKPQPCRSSNAPDHSAASTSPIKTGIDLADVKMELEDQEVVEYVEVDSSSIAPSEMPAPSPAPSDMPAPGPPTSPCAIESVPSPPPSPCAIESIPSRPPAERQPMVEANHRSQKNSRPRRHRNENLPSWAYELEERRIATEERLVEEVAGLNSTNRAMLACMQQLVRILEGRLHNS